MTNKTELPDLDRLEALARAATAGPWLHRRDPSNPGAQHCVKLAGEHGPWVCDCIDNADRSTIGGIAGERNASFIAAANPAAVLALIEMARRAQPEGEARCAICGSTEPRTGTCGSDDPRALCKATTGKPEGEAPQAEPIGQVVMYPNYSTVIRWRDGVTPPAGTLLYDHAPAAQHAESGAQEIEQTLEDLMHKHELIGVAGDNPNWEAKLIAFATDAHHALAAQSQGAQPTVKGRSVYQWYVTYCETSEKLKAANGCIERYAAALAAKAEAPAPRWAPINTLPYADDLVWLRKGDSIEGPRPMDTDDYDRFTEWSPCEPPAINQPRAQHAAAPGSIDERQAFEAMVRTWDVPADALERWPDGRYVQEQIEQCWSGWESRSKLFPSAPGTPEAPAGYAIVPIEATERMIYEGGIGRRDQMVDAADVWRQMVRAAQLDGGQGEEASHA